MQQAVEKKWRTRDASRAITGVARWPALAWWLPIEANLGLAVRRSWMYRIARTGGRLAVEQERSGAREVGRWRGRSERGAGDRDRPPWQQVATGGASRGSALLGTRS